MSSSGEECQNNNNNSSISFLASFLLQCEAFVVVKSESSFILGLVQLLRRLLQSIGAPLDYGPTPLDTSRAVFAIALTLLLYFVLFGYRHWCRRHKLSLELQAAKQELAYLQERLLESSSSSTTTTSTEQNNNKKKEIRIFMDGAFDMMHYGHMNAFRLAKSLGTHLVVGVNSDESITKCKGPPLMNDEERLTMVSMCKFVDQVVPNCPYIMNQDYLEWVCDKYHIDYVVHGDDPCIVDGKDVYETAKASGKFRTIPRTDGVSTTDIVGRMLLLTREHHLQQGEGAQKVLGRQSKFLTTSRMVQLFSSSSAGNNKKTPPTPDMKVIYIDGAWDLFHPGHVAILKAAKSRGDYLIVGIHGDAVVNARRGMNLPLLNLHERVLSVLGCRFVDDVLIDAPNEITPEMIASLKINEVVHGTLTDDFESTVLTKAEEEGRYKHAKAANIFTMIESPTDFGLESILKRIHKNQEVFQQRFERKMMAETQHYQQKYGAAATNGKSTANGT